MARRVASTVPAYLASLPPDRRKVIAAVRRVIRSNLPRGYAESMNWGAICYEVPLKTYPETYNRRPLLYVSVAAQKNNYVIYLMPIYSSEGLSKRLREGFAAIGRKPDIGKACVRFKRLEDIPLETIGKIVSAIPVATWVDIAKQAHRKK